MPFRSDMEVLTLAGWRQFSTLKGSERLAMPDPENRKFGFEKAKVRAFKTDEPLMCCSHKQIAFGLTCDHDYKLEFDTMSGYRYVDSKGELDPKAQLAAFWCGDGYKISKNRIGFGLKKDRKKAYLKGILKSLDIKYKAGPHTNRPGYLDFVINTNQEVVQEVLNEYIHDWEALAKNKHLSREKFAEGDGSIIRGFFDALMNADGHVKKDRPQLQFTSTSQSLHSDFQLLSAMLGRDAHFTHHEKKEQTLSYNPENNQTMSVKKADVRKESFEGVVYSAETSNGLVLVRGNSRQFGFVARGA